MTIEYHLYSSEGCHLCEQALELFKQVTNSNNLTVIDIVDTTLDETNLVELYGVHIPVLERISDNATLFWPFNAEQIKVFVQLR
jgi:hypothetical protein